MSKDHAAKASMPNLAGNAPSLPSTWPSFELFTSARRPRCTLLLVCNGTIHVACDKPKIHLRSLEALSKGAWPDTALPGNHVCIPRPRLRHVGLEEQGDRIEIEYVTEKCRKRQVGVPFEHNLYASQVLARLIQLLELDPTPQRRKESILDITVAVFFGVSLVLISLISYYMLSLDIGPDDIGFSKGRGMLRMMRSLGSTGFSALIGVILVAAVVYWGWAVYKRPFMNVHQARKDKA